MRRLTALFVGIALVASSIQAFAAALTVGMSAPAIKVSKWVKGTPVTEFKKGNLYVVEFWATWCGPCRVSIPHLTELAEKYKDKVTFVGVSVWEDDQANVKPFVDKMGDKMGYNVAMDDQKSATDKESGFMNKNWMLAAGQNGIPTAFVVDKTGSIAWIGHPMMLDPVLADVVADKWDIKKAQEEIAKRQAEQEEQKKRAEAMQKAPSTPERKKLITLVRAKKWPEALEQVKVIAGLKPDAGIPDPKEWATYMELTIYSNMGDLDKFYSSASSSFDVLKESPMYLNAIAWSIVGDDSKLAKKDFDIALKYANQACEDTKFKEPSVLDTLAWSYYRKGDKANAVKFEKQALALVPAEEQGDFKKSLQTFEGA